MSLVILTVLIIEQHLLTPIKTKILRDPPRNINSLTISHTNVSSTRVSKHIKHKSP